MILYAYLMKKSKTKLNNVKFKVKIIIVENITLRLLSIELLPAVKLFFLFPLLQSDAHIR